MAIPKKKIPSGPIRIQPTISKQLPQSNNQDTSKEEESKPEAQKQDSSKPDSLREDLATTSTIQDSAIPESFMEENLNLPFNNHQNKILEIEKQDSSFQEETILDSSSQIELEQYDNTSSIISPDPPNVRNVDSSLEGTSSLESTFQEVEYKKVSMRLSSESVEQLQSFRASTGIPYEILVDVMIRNWEILPQRTRASYLEQAKQLRISRLIAGQEKTMKTLKNKYKI